MNWNRKVDINGRKVGDGESVYVIAEVGSNHNQSIEFAFESIDAAAECGADAVKFQSLKFDELYSPKSAPKGALELFESIKLEENWHKKLNDYSKKRKIQFFSAPTYPNAVNILKSIDCPVIKIASPQFGFYPDIHERALKYGKPIIYSVGLASIGEIDQVMRLSYNSGFRDGILLHCVSQYPTPPTLANLSMIETYSQMLGCLVGYSDHTLGIHFPIAAVARGACVIEKHFTLDKTLDGPDHHFAIEPKELKEMVGCIRDIEVGIGNGIKPELTEWESAHKNRITMRLVAKEAISKGKKITDENFILRRAEIGLTHKDSDLISQYDCFALKNIEEGEVLSLENICVHGKPV